MRIACLPLYLLPVFAHALSLDPRQATCGGVSDLQQCGEGFPSAFCCPKDSKCMSLNSPDVHSVICCPAGSDCAYIQPITCDVTQLNATLHPDNQMHLSETDGIDLPKCGEKCCPLGYSCKGGMCSKDPGEPATPTSSVTPSPSATDSASNSQTSACAPVAAAANRGFDGKAFAAGLIPGIVIGALGAIGLLWAINKHRDAKARRYSGDFGHVARKISDPIYDPEHAARTDFIRQPSHSAGRPSTQRSQETANGTVVHHPPRPVVGTGFTPRIRSMWDRTPKINFGFNGGLPANPAPPPPAVRAGYGDPYTTPQSRRNHSRQTSTSSRSHRSHRSRRSHHSIQQTPQQHQQMQQYEVPHPSTDRADSTETIDVLMPAPSFLGSSKVSGGTSGSGAGFLAPPKAPGMRENRFTSSSANTTFTKLMERAGFDDSEHQKVRNYTPGNNRI